VLVALPAMWAIAAPARSFSSGPVSASLTEAGGGWLTANGAGNPPSQTWTWQICNQAGEACRPFGSGQQIQAGSPPGGTTFRATSNTGMNGLSPIWNGPLHVAAAPTVTGAVQANQLVTPVPAVWEGGWTGDFTRTQLSLCSSTAGTGCIAPLEFYGGSCPTGALTIDKDFTGWWLRAATTVYGPDTGFATPAIVSPDGYGAAIWSAGATTSVAVLGRVAPASGPPAGNCGPPALFPGLPPLIALKVQSAGISDDGAVVRCSRSCTVSFHASRRGRVATATKNAQGEIRLRIPHGSLARLGRGSIRYTLFVDGHRVAQATIRR